MCLIGKTQLLCLQCRRPGFDPWVGKIPWRKKWQPTPVLLPGKFHGLRSLVGYSLWCRKELDMTEGLLTHSLTLSHHSEINVLQLRDHDYYK